MASSLQTTISSTAHIQGAGPVQVFDSTAFTALGLWYPVNPRVRQMSVQANLTGSSVGAVVQASLEVQASLDGAVRVNTLLGTIAVTGISPSADGLAVDAHWKYIRVVNSSGTTQSANTSISVSVDSWLH